MKFKILLLIAGLAFMADGCVSDREKNILEIRKAEAAFARMASEKGIPEAFFFFAADSGIIMRNNRLIVGKDSILGYYKSRTVGEAQLKWSPDFIDVAESGDLGYTYGTYTFTFRDTAGVIRESRGFFHTVWKRQPDGSWRFVWD